MDYYQPNEANTRNLDLGILNTKGKDMIFIQIYCITK